MTEYPEIIEMPNSQSDAEECIGLNTYFIASVLEKCNIDFLDHDQLLGVKCWVESVKRTSFD